MKRIKVTKTMNGSPDGIKVHRYHAGETYEMPDGLANVFLRERWGEEDRPITQPKTESKDMGAAPSNKMSKEEPKKETK